MYYHFKILNEENGFWADCIELKGCRTQGESLDELNQNMEEALNLYLDEPAHSNLIFPKPQKSIPGKNIVKVKVDSKIAFATLLRQARLNKNWTQKQMADKMGFKSIFAYQKLEKSSSANPQLTTLSKIKELLPALKLEELFS